MVTDRMVPQSRIKSNRSNELIRIADDENGNREIGIAYITEDKAEIIKESIIILKNSGAYQKMPFGKKLRYPAKS